MIVGNEEGQVPLGKLQRHLMKLPRNITAKDMDTLEQKLTALGSARGRDAEGPDAAGREDAVSVQRTVKRR